MLTMLTHKQKTVFVAMSGGVDSSVATALLKERGFDVVGIFMRNWSGYKGHGCGWEEDQEMARMAAAIIGVPFYTWNFEDEYKERVVAYMIREYRGGRTPNPDVMCNKVIKFGLFFEKAMCLGADFVATGHYVRVRQSSERFELLRGIDEQKDQSYFLWTLREDHLRKTLFPIGDYRKGEVRKLAKKFHLPNATRPDSQGLCFVGKVRFTEFLKEFLPEKVGSIMTEEGKIIGIHPGIQFYTIGQRRGIGIGGGKPYFVAAKEPRENILYVVEGENHPALYRGACYVRTWHWISRQVPHTPPFRAQARIRYRQPLQWCRVNEAGVTFEVPQRAGAPGQSIVLYHRDVVLGGGVIEGMESLIASSPPVGVATTVTR